MIYQFSKQHEIFPNNSVVFGIAFNWKSHINSTLSEFPHFGFVSTVKLKAICSPFAFVVRIRRTKSFSILHRQDGCVFAQNMNSTQTFSLILALATVSLEWKMLFRMLCARGAARGSLLLCVESRVSCVLSENIFAMYEIFRFLYQVWSRFVSHSHASVYKKPLNAIVMLHDLLSVRMWKKNVKPNFEFV